MAKMTVAQWTLIKTLYESGKFRTMNDLRDYCKKAFPGQTIPTISAFEKHSSQDGWEKSSATVEIQDKIYKTTTETFAELGMPKEEVLRNVIDMVRSGSDTIERMVARINARAKKGKDRLIDERELKELKNHVSNFKIRKDGIELYLKLTGESAPVKVDHTSKGDRIPSVIQNLQEITDEELLEKMQRIHKRIAPD
jgi:hypothetical protein